MRWLLVIALAACGPKSPPPVVADPAVPRLPPPPLLDPDVRGAPYLTAVALQLSPGWQQFLEDCRLRLSARHPLNQLTLAATAELAIDARGQVVEVRVATSGNPGFDHAVRQVISDAAPLPKPPRDLWSDDDRVHLRWLFARDRRQAGPATASVVAVQLPLRDAMYRLLFAGDLARAARRIVIEPPGPERINAAQALMAATLHEGLGSSDSSVRRAAIEAINLAGVGKLAQRVRDLVTATSDIELRLTALANNLAAPETLLDQLRVDLRSQPRLALAEVKALADQGQGAAAAAIVRGELEASANSPNPVALQALARAPVRELAPKLTSWMANADARVRAGACTALGGYPPVVAWPLLARGLKDRDAVVRARCADAADDQLVPKPDRIEILDPHPKQTEAARIAAIDRLAALGRDRDRAVRARALVAIARLDRTRLTNALDDAAPQVRAAYATALAISQASTADAHLRTLIDDRDPDVRAAAWSAARELAIPTIGKEALRAIYDSAPQVRRAVVPLIVDDDTLWKIANNDDTPEVRTAAMVQLARVRTRDSLTDVLLQRLAAAPPGSAERVRTALAWLLAR